MVASSRQLRQSFAESRIKSLQKYKQAKKLNQLAEPQPDLYRSSRQKGKKLFSENALEIKNKCRVKRYKTFIKRQ